MSLEGVLLCEDSVAPHRTTLKCKKVPICSSTQVGVIHIRSAIYDPAKTLFFGGGLAGSKKARTP